MLKRSRKRSSCASGSGKVPSSSTGFCVASTRKGRGSGRGDAVHRDLALLHRFQQRRLGARRGAVDLVGQHHLAHQRARPELEVLRLLVEPVDAGDIRRQQIGRELDAPEGAAQRDGQGACQRRLADAGHVFHQDVALAQHGRQRQVDDVVLADDDFLDVGAQPAREIVDHSHPCGGISREYSMRPGGGCYNAAQMRTLIALDLETTGLDPERDAVIEIGAVRFRGPRLEAQWSTLVNPGRPIPPFVVELTGIDDGMVARAPRLSEALAGLVEFCGDATLIGHNVGFDLAFLRPHGALTFNEAHDTLEMASVLLPTAARYGLGPLASELGVPVAASHRALDDAQTTRQVYQHLFQAALELPSAGSRGDHAPGRRDRLGRGSRFRRSLPADHARRPRSLPGAAAAALPVHTSRPHAAAAHPGGRADRAGWGGAFRYPRARGPTGGAFRRL